MGIIKFKFLKISHIKFQPSLSNWALLWIIMQKIGIVQQLSVEVFYTELTTPSDCSGAHTVSSWTTTICNNGCSFWKLSQNNCEKRQTVNSLVMSVCLSVCLSTCNSWAPMGRIFVKLYWGCSLAAADQMQVWLKPYKTTELLSLCEIYSLKFHAAWKGPASQPLT